MKKRKEKYPFDWLKIITAGVLGCTIIASCGPIRHLAGLEGGWSSPWRISGETINPRPYPDCEIAGTYYNYGERPNKLYKKVYGQCGYVQDCIVNLGNPNIAELLNNWDAETANIPAGWKTHNGPGVRHNWVSNQLHVTGFWHVCSRHFYEPIVVAVVPPGEKIRVPGPLQRECLDLDFIFQGTQQEEDWQLTGALPQALYLPLKHLLSTCALQSPIPGHRERLVIPVIVGKDAQGKDMIVMKPLITKVINDDGQRVQAFTGNKKEDQYFDKKFNSP